MKNLIPVITACLMGWTAFAADPSNSPVFQIRQILDAPSGDSEQMSIPHNERPAEAVYVGKTVLLDQTSVKSAKMHTDSLGHPQIEIVFNEEGRKRFAEVSRQNIGKRLAIVVAGQIQCAPTIRSEISGGKAEISGSFTEQEAKDLARKITDSLAKK